MSRMPACLALLMLAAAGPLAAAADLIVPAADLPVDFARPLEVEVSLRKTDGTTGFGELPRYLEQQGFALSFKLDYLQQEDAMVLRGTVLRATRTGVIPMQQLDALMVRVDELSQELDASTHWSFRQGQGQGRR